MADPYLRFEATLPQDATMPIKPTRDINALTSKRRVRVWLDAFLSPGETELALLLSDETFDVAISRRPKPAGGSTLHDETPEALRQAADPPGLDA